MAIDYRTGGDLDLGQVRDLYRASTLAERRPVEDDARLRQMMTHANLVVTAWEEGLLVGLSRALTDFGFTTYLADLAVRVSHQRRGIGRELVRLTREAAPLASIVLLAAPAAERYYPRIGFTHHPQAWVLRQGQKLV